MRQTLSVETMHKRHKIQFPRNDAHDLQQDEAYFYLLDGAERHRIRFHDYDTIYNIPGLYEQLFYDRLKCRSPDKVTEILRSAVAQSNENFTELRVLDFGAGNGIMAEHLKKVGVSRIVGIDIIPEARNAAERDRPGIYDDYFVADLCEDDASVYEDIASWSLDCLTTVAALGFGDVPPLAFLRAFNLLQDQGWVAFNIKENFLDHTDHSGFAQTIRDLIFSKYMDLYHLERYRHRLSIDGEPLYYYAIAGRKNANIPQAIIAELLAA